MANIQPGAGDNIKDFTAINMWYERLNERYNFSLGSSILPLMTSDSLKQLGTLDPPFLKGNKENISEQEYNNVSTLSSKTLSHVSHPPHLDANHWSSAFIPFCVFKTDLNISKSTLTLPGINFPLCSSFLPTILEGQLCYKLTLNETSGQGKRNELMLLLDYNEDRSLQTSFGKDEADKSSNKTLNFDTSVDSIQGVSAKVHINTLSPYVSFGGEIYMMSVVKRMTAKEDFLKMPLKDRNCEVEQYEDCKTRKLLKECNCVPAEVPGFQVGTTQYHNMYKCFPRTWGDVAQKAGTALRETQLVVSTAV